MYDFFSDFGDFFLDGIDGAAEGGFSLNATTDGSDEEDVSANAGDLKEAPINSDGSINTDKITKQDSEYWDPDEGMAVTGTGASNVVVKGAEEHWTGGSVGSGVRYFLFSWKTINSLGFANGGGTIQFGQNNELEIEVSSAGLNFSANNGKVTGGFFGGSTRGAKVNNSFRLTNIASIAYGEKVDATNGISVELEGFPADIDYLDEEGNTAYAAATFQVDGTDLKSITTSDIGNEAGTITVKGDLSFNLNGEAFKLKAAVADGDDDLSEPVVFKYEDGEMTVDLSNIAPTLAGADDIINLSATGGADNVIPPTSAAGTLDAIKISGTTYQYVSGGEAYFTLNSKGVVDGYVFEDDGDAISVPSGAKMTIYDGDTKLTDVTKAISGGSYLLTKEDDGSYSATFTESLTISDDNGIKMAFSLKGTEVKVFFDDEGAITAVDGLDDLAGKEYVTVTGAKATNDESGLPIGADPENLDGYIAISSGSFTIKADEVIETTATNDTIYGLPFAASVVVPSGTRTLSDDENTYAYTSGGAATFGYNGGLTSFEFKAAGDSVTISDANDDIDLIYDGDEFSADVPTVTDSDNTFKLTMTEAGVFSISDLEAGAVVADGDAEITFSAADGTALFNVEGELVGVTAESGTITFNEDAAELLEDGDFTINGVALPEDFEADGSVVYNADNGELLGDGVVYGNGNKAHTFTNGTFTIAGETDGFVTFTLDAAGNVTAIDGLDDGTVTGNFAGVVSPTVNGYAISTTDTSITVTGDGNGISAVDDLDNGELVLGAGDSGIAINGSALTYAINSGATAITVTGNTEGIASATGFGNNDIITVGNDDAVIGFNTDSTDGQTVDTFTVNNKVYTVTGDDNGISISGSGNVTGLDENASLTVSAGPVTVNAEPYTAEDIDTINADGESIVGYTKKSGTESAYVTDANHPLINRNTTRDFIRGYLGIPAFGTDQIFFESNDDNLDRSTDTLPAEVFINDDGTSTTKFNDLGKNLAIVTGTATGDKSIILGAKGDGVIMDGRDEYGSVNITTGAGNDTIVVRGPALEDAVLTGTMKTTIDMGGAGNGIDKVITYAAANANITLNNYDETSQDGIVIHDPEIPNIKNLRNAIDDELLVFEDGQVVAIDRDETRTGIDRKTSIKVNNNTTAHQTMVRLYGYKDNKDVYSDDFGQLVGFTGNAGGVLDASDIEENVYLIGNKNSAANVAGSSLRSGTGDDVLYGGAGDTLNAGKGSNTIVLDDSENRGAATVVIGQGVDTIENLQTGFDGDILDVSNVDLSSSATDITFADGTLSLTDTSAKSTTTAAVANDTDFVEQLLRNSAGETVKAAVAKDGGTITVGSEAPNYYAAPNGAVDFSAYTGEVNVDIDNDWVQSAVGGETATFAGGINSLIGGSGNTLFKGGSADETLVAGTGESSLYGAGGKNQLTGATTDKVGSTEFFVLGINNGAQNTISNFEFIADGGSNTATFDALALGMGDNNDVTGIQVSGDNVEIALRGNESGAVEKVTIEGAAGKEFLVDRGTQTETVAQIAASEVTVNNSYVDFYAATEKNATVKIGDIAEAKVWLEAPDFSDGIDYVGDFTVIDARGSSAAVEMAGNNVSNTIYGGLGNASMWGGAGSANDVMYGGSAHNEFYYETGNGNDTIMSANDGDIIHLGATLDQIDFDGTTIGASGIEVKFTDGGTLNINSGAEVSFSFDDGTNVKANRQTQQFE